MATTLLNLETYTRALLREATASGYTQAQINVWLNEAQRIFCQRTGILKTITTYATVAAQRDYALPSNLIDFNSIRSVFYDQDTKLQKLDPVQFYNAAANDPYQSGAPEIYFVEDGRLHVWPIPSTSEDAATTTLGAAMNDTTGTTATVADNSVFPYASGRIIIDTEVMEFRGRSGTTGLTGIRRGIEGSTAATHLNAAPITERDLWVHHLKTPTTMTASIDTEIPDSYAQILTHYAAWMGFSRRGDLKQAQAYQQQWEMELQRAWQETAGNEGRKDRYHQILPIEAVGRTKYGRI